jgi:hypothetical protein
LSGDFRDLAGCEGWSIPLNLDVDLKPLRNLKHDSTPDAEVLNSLLVWQCLSRLTPSLASEGRIWAQLTHVEALPYCRARWVGKRVGAAAKKSIEVHFFGETRTRCRDDNAIGRLWWNAHIARMAMPDQHQLALKTMLKTADIRSNVIERPWISSRPPIAGGIVRTLVRKPKLGSNEQGFRDFMKSLNRRGGGVLFEVMNESEIDAFMDDCASGI